MNEFLQMAGQERALFCEQAEARTGLSRQSIEKDFWVCWTLDRLFCMAQWGPEFTFKGGTSLSKAWGLIRRFSEDIDIVISRPFLGVREGNDPESALSKKQRAKRLADLKNICRHKIADDLHPALAASIAEALPDTSAWSLTEDPDDPDQQSLLFAYPFATGQSSYIAPVVKIEMGARSDTSPSQEAIIRPILAETFPDLIPEASVTVRALAPERTFWEKAMLLHEEHFRPSHKSRPRPLARHYYDLWCLITQGVGERAAGDADLFQRVATHRAIFFHWSWMDYSTLRPGHLQITPPPSQLPVWRADYDAMKSEMFYGETPSFEEVLGVVSAFQEAFNRKT